MAKINLIISTGMALVLIILLAFAVSAFGVASSYWEGNPLQVSPGETQTADLFLQNMLEEDDVTLQAKITRGNEIASLDKLEYTVKAGTKDTEVPVNVKIPSNATVGTEYQIIVSFQTITPGGTGVVFGTGVDTTFDVLVVGKPESEKLKSKTILIFVLIGAIILLILLVILILKRIKRKGKKRI